MSKRSCVWLQKLRRVDGEVSTDNGSQEFSEEVKVKVDNVDNLKRKLFPSYDGPSRAHVRIYSLSAASAERDPSWEIRNPRDYLEGNATYGYIDDNQTQSATPPLHQTQEQSKEHQMVYAYVKEEMDNRTKHKAMSEASVPFAEAILKGYGLRVVVDPPVKELGSKKDPPTYSWKVVDNNARVWKKSEHAGTPGARDWTHAHLLAGEREYGLKVVTGALLPEVKANRRSSSGKGDIAIGKLEDMNYGEVYLFANGLIELKTDEYPLKTGQNLLQLLSLSTISSFGKGVALLATDCNTKWETFHFSEKRVVRRRIYKHGQKAWEDFMELIRSPEDRVYPELAAIEENGKAEEDDQNLDGFDLPDQDSKKLKAVEDHAILEQLADHLGVIYGERPVVPMWARAEARIPDYYV